MSSIISTPEEIPAFSFYVTCTDTFMSYWGRSKNKPNVCIFPCDTLDQAETVANNASGRTDQTNVRIHESKPTLSEANCYSLFSQESAEPWYEEGTWVA